MRRLNPVVLAVVGGLLTLTILPMTRWIVENHAGFLVGHTIAGDVGGGLEPRDYAVYMPRAAINSEAWSAPSPDHELGTAMALLSVRTRTGEKQDPGNRYPPLADYLAKHPDDKVARSIYASRLSTGLISALGPQRGIIVTPAVLKSRVGAAKKVLEVTDGWERFDADNAFFPLMRSFALRVLGRQEEAVAQFHLAATLPRYAFYGVEGAEAQWEATEARFGYHGQAIRMDALASILLPHVSLIRTSGRWAISTAGEAGRADAAKIAMTIVRTSDYPIDCIVAAALFYTVLTGDDKNVSRSKWSMPVLEAAAKRHDSPAMNYSELLATMKPLMQPNLSFMPTDDSDPSLLLLLPRVPAGAGLLLLMLLAYPLSWAFSWLTVQRSEWLRGLMVRPHLVWLLIPMLPNEQAGMAVPALTVIGLMLLATSLLAPISARKWVRIAGYVLAFACLFFAGVDWPIGGLVAVFYAGSDLLGLGKPRGGVLPAVVATTVMVLVGVLSLYTTMSGTPGSHYPWFMLAIALVSLIALVPRLTAWPRRTAPIVLAVAAIGYLGVVGWELRDDRALGEIVVRWCHEGDAFRQRIGLRG